MKDSGGEQVCRWHALIEPWRHNDDIILAVRTVVTSFSRGRCDVGGVGWLLTPTEKLHNAMTATSVWLQNPFIFFSLMRVMYSLC